MLKVGDRVPAFTLESDSAGQVSSTGLAGKRYVLYFYPRDDTPGCTMEACSFRDNLPLFGGLNVPVFGVSADDVRAHAKFTAKFSLNFPLLADPEHQLVETMGVWGEKTFMGRKYMGVSRATFVVGGDGCVERVWEKVTPLNHAEEVLAYLKGDAAPEPPGASKDAATPGARKKTASKK